MPSILGHWKLKKKFQKKKEEEEEVQGQSVIVLPTSLELTV